MYKHDNWYCMVDEDFRGKQIRQRAVAEQQSHQAKEQSKNEPIKWHISDPAWFKKADSSS